MLGFMLYPVGAGHSQNALDTQLSPHPRPLPPPLNYFENAPTQVRFFLF
jgi:hypothetical protein